MTEHRPDRGGPVTSPARPDPDPGVGLGEAVRRLAAPLAADAGIELVEVDVRGSRGSRVVRVVGDAAEGVTVDRLAELSRQLEARLDDRELVDGGYTLEVSSPGLDQLLQTAADFARRVGREVRVLRNQARPEGAPGEVVGTVRSVTEQTVTLEIDGQTHELTLEEIEHGKVVLPW